MNKQKVIRLTAVAVATVTVLAGAFAYYTDYVSTTLSAVSSSLSIEMSEATEDLTNGLKVIDPGVSNDLSFTINNTGSKSADIKAVITVASEKAMSSDHEYKVTDNNGIELTGELSADGKTLVYTVDDVTINGSAEKETGITTTAHTYDYQFEMDADASNDWQNIKANVTIEVYAKQHRNTEGLGSDWTSIVEK